MSVQNFDRTITALRAAIAEASMQRITDVQQEMEQEPVAWLQIGGPLHDNIVIARTDKPKEWNPEWWRFEPLYAHPPRREWVGLTDEEQFQIVLACGCASEDWLLLARAIEAKLKEKNT